MQLEWQGIAAMTKPIEFYFDFASQYGFLATMQIDAPPRALTWRPFLLGVVYKRFGQSPLDHPLKRDYIIKVDAPRMARRIGLDLKVPAGFPEHALPPSRVFYWIEEQGPGQSSGVRQSRLPQVLAGGLRYQ